MNSLKEAKILKKQMLYLLIRKNNLKNFSFVQNKKYRIIKNKIFDF